MARTWRSQLVEDMLARAMSDQFRPENLPKDFGLAANGYRLSDVQAQRILEMQLQRLTGLEQDKILSEYREVIAAIEDLLDILAKPERVTQIIADELAGDQARVRRRAPQRDRGERAGPLHGGPHRPRGRRGDALARRLREEPEARRVPRAEARRPRQAGDHDQGRRLHREALHRQHARLRAVLLEQGQGLLDQGLRGAAGQPRQPRQADREPAQDGRGRAHQRDPAGARVRRGPLRVLRHAAGRGEEDGALGLLAAARRRDHRGGPRRGRPPDRGGAHRRPPRRDALLRRGQGRALRRGRRAPDGPRRARACAA